MTCKTSDVAAWCSSAVCNSRESRATSASRSVAGGLRRMLAFSALRRLGITVLRRRDLPGSPLVLERRLIAFPKAQVNAS
jgi:hypothetical protein